MSRFALKAVRHFRKGHFHSLCGLRNFTQPKREFSRLKSFQSSFSFHRSIPSKFNFSDFLSNVDEYVQNASKGLVEDLSKVAGRIPISVKAQTLFQPLLMSIHGLTGIPYWGAICGLSVALRMLLVPFYVISVKEDVKKRSHQREIDNFQQRIKMADSKDKRVLKMELGEFYKKKGIKEWKRFGTLLQIPLLVPMFFTLRSMSKSMAAFQTSKLLWCSSLAAPDPYFILPIVNALLMFLNMHVSQKISGQKMPWWLPYGTSALSAVFMLKFSSCFFVYWIPLQIMTLLQNLIMDWYFSRDSYVSKEAEKLEAKEKELDVSFHDTADGSFFKKE